MSKEKENILIPCSFGIFLLMCSLLCVIFLGTSYLIPDEPYTDLSSLFGSAALALVVSSIFGGYLVSYGLKAILQCPDVAESGTQD